MKTGPQPDTQKSRLSMKLAQMQTEQEDLMASHMSAFVKTSQTMLNDAQTTMKNDTAHFLFHNRNLFEERIELIKNWMTFSPWIITGIIVTGIVLMMVASWLWTVQLTRSELTELGLTRIDREDGTWVVLDRTKTRLRTCTMGGRSVTCIKIEEN
ncbi:hypothetical protein ROLI_025610 [Roseobacter fucihabitans]|uniref:MobB n=1 Tax=Roseobacter fucihabitans TaxID=1537242 RepID=A0ABZ2BVV4_9RHOB|nr:hypothetical protein [Roseobacter litoralis]MBC6967611.1 hypothetical protein [Roseobacter litoralis]